MKATEKPLLFKKPISLVVVLVPLFLFNCVATKQCKCKKKAAPLEIISTVTAIHGIAFFDVNSAILQNVRNVKVTLIDPEKMVLSSNGFPFDSVRLKEGIMSIGLSTKAQFSVERPYRFTIRAEADGYMTNTRSMVITSAVQNYFPIFLAKLDNSGLPSSGLAATAGELSSVSGGVFTRDEVLMTANTTVDSLIIRIPNGTRIFNGDKPVTEAGPLSYRLLSGTARDTNANRVFPGGFEVTDAIDQTGQKIASATNPAFFTTAGWFSLEMNIGNIEVNRFSNPLDVLIPVSDSVINPATQKVIKAGDKIPIWGMNNAGTWRLESEAEIISSAGGLRANIRINHLSPFNLDFKGPKCGTALVVTYTPAEFPTSYYSEYIRTSDNAVLKEGIVDYAATPGSQSIIRAPDVGMGRLYVHDGASQTDGGRGISDPLGCTGPTTAPLNYMGTTPTSSCITIKFLRQDGTNLCDNNVWLEAVGGTYHINMGVINTGTVNIPLTTGNQTIELYYGKMMSLSPVLMRITLNVDLPVGDEAEPQVIIDGINYTGASYFRDNSGPCGRTITVTIPNSIITASSIKCS